MGALDKRIIMVEGCDRTGKSTFIDYLSDELKILGYRPFVLPLMGPTKFSGLSFSDDERSLIQLAKFNDEYDIVRGMLKCDSKARFIFDRTSFGEYVWSKYWSREGKWTGYVTSPEFIGRHRDLMDETLYIEFHMSDVAALERRITSSQEDLGIFTIGGRTVRESISYVYGLYAELAEIVKGSGIDYLKIDSSQFRRPEDDGEYVSRMLRRLMRL